MPSLIDKVALVTGAARGNGRADAQRLAEEGADIIAVDICGPIQGAILPPSTPEDLEETVRIVEKTGRKIVARIVDTRDLPALRTAVLQGIHELGRLDIVVANAGTIIPGEWRDLGPQDFETTVSVNLTGTWNTIMATAPYLVDQGEGGSIIIQSSTAGLKGIPFMNPYVATEHALTGLARCFANELAPHRIRVNSVHPTGVNTVIFEFTQRILAPILKRHPHLAGIFTNSLDVQAIEPRDVGATVAHLASEDARWMTGSAVVVDAGSTQY